MPIKTLKEEFFSHLSYDSNRSRLSWRMVRFVIFCSSIFTLIATVYQLYSGYTEDRSALLARMSEIEVSTVPIIAESVWQLDTPAVKTQLSSLVDLHDIVFVELKRDDKIFAFGSMPDDQRFLLKRIFDLTYHFENTLYSLGSFEVYGSLENAIATVKKRFLVILFSNAIKTFLVAFAIFFGFQYLIVRHLSHLVNYLTGMELTNPNKPIALERSSSGNDDELTDLVNCINDLRLRIAHSIDELTEKQDWLTLLTNNLPVLISYIDSEKRYRFCNQRYEYWFGQPSESFHGKTIKEVLGDDAYAVLQPYVLGVLAGRAQSFVCTLPFR